MSDFILNRRDLLRTKAYVAGAWIDADDDETFPVHNPATGDLIGTVARCGRDETARAIQAAAGAQTKWANRPAKDRSAVLRAWHSLILDNMDDLATIVTAEQGKPLSEALGEIQYGANYVEWFAEEAKRVYGDTIPGPSVDKRILTLKQPIGVVACITPWNFPSAMLARKIAPALAAGCAVVCKPANATPLSALALAKLAQDAGIPDGLINVLAGVTAEIGTEMTSNPIVRKITFTGSTKVGKALMAAAASTVKRTSMELGGNAPFIVFEDANLDQAVENALISKFRNAGQTCICANRFLIHDRVYDEFAQKLSRAVGTLKIGDGRDNASTIGPLINAMSADDVLATIDDAVALGARVAIGGQRSILGPAFVEPTVLTDARPDMRVFKEEIFGPVAPLFRFSNEAEAIALANDTPFGLASYIFTRDFGRIMRVSELLEFGMVGVNDSAISNEMAPFGGVKQSGHGREGSKYGLDDYLEIKYLSLGGIS